MSPIIRKVLFVCIHNSARSQMAEAFLNKYGSGLFAAESAGLEPGKLNPRVVEVMQEAGIDISQKTTQGVQDLLQQGRPYDIVITVCDGASAEKCPVFPGKGKKLSWFFDDPSAFKGSGDGILAQTRVVREEIKIKVLDFIRAARLASYWA